MKIDHQAWSKECFKTLAYANQYELHKHYRVKPKKDWTQADIDCNEARNKWLDLSIGDNHHTFKAKQVYKSYNLLQHKQ
jgi:DNA replication protein DnaD